MTYHASRQQSNQNRPLALLGGLFPELRALRDKLYAQIIELDDLPEDYGRLILDLPAELSVWSRVDAINAFAADQIRRQEEMLKLVTATERLATRKDTIVVVGRSKVGKTTLVQTLPERETAFIDLEAGMGSISGWKGDSFPIRTWDDLRDIVVLLGGADPARAAEEPLSQAHYNYVRGISSGIDPDRYRYIFVDSVTDLSRIGFHWSKSQPEAFSPRTGRQDLRGAYGLLGRSVIDVLKHLQHAPDKTAILVGGLDHRVDEQDVWLGVTAENQTEAARRLPILVSLPAVVRFVSAEPLLEEVVLSPQWLARIDWVICGGETGRRARYMEPSWARGLLRQCRAAGVCFFMKQMTRRAPIPGDLLVREWPR